MRKKRNIKLRKQLHDILREKYKLGRGVAKHEIKDNHNATRFIHSSRTYETYRQQIGHFADWCKVKGIKDIPTAEKAVNEYMEKLSADGKSASSQSTALCALAKVFDKRTTDFGYKLPERRRSEIKRSRYAVARDKHFNPNSIENQALIKFCVSTGLRRDELKHLNGSDLRFKDGRAYLYVHDGTKGGKSRNIEILGNIKFVTNMCKRADNGRVFPKVHSCADIHSYRATYARNLYLKYARTEIPREDRYICRGDYKGKVFDKRAMAIVSQNLGHNRIGVIASNYLYGL